MLVQGGRLENLAHVEAHEISSTPRISGPGHHDRSVLDTNGFSTLTEIRLPIALSPFGSIGTRHLPITNVEIDHVRYKISKLLRLARWFKANLQSRLWLALLRHQSHNLVDHSMPQRLLLSAGPLKHS
jgi:hypothetical protein